MIKTGRQANVLLGHGDVSKFNLLGSSFGNAGDVVLFGSGAQAHFRRGPKDTRMNGYAGLGGPRPPGSGNGCVHVDSWLPGGLRAGDVAVGDTLLLINGEYGVVTHSETKTAPLWRVVTAAGVSLVCSADAPIPVKAGGYRTPPTLTGHQLRPRIGGKLMPWDVVCDVQAMGEGLVQHITCENECFWAGEQPGACLPHHNAKPIDQDDSNDRSGRRGDR